MGRKIKHNYNQVYQEHLNGKSLKNISKELKIPLSSIYDYFKKNNIVYNKNIPARHVGFWVNDSYLDNVDSEDKAYFLGWMFSDGYINKNRIFLTLQKKDSYIIKEIFSKFSSGYKLSENKSKTSATMTIASTKITDKLRKLGCVQNKTHLGFKIPDIPKELFRHYLRGYFDGDGSIGKRTARPKQLQINICSIDKNFLEDLQCLLREFKINSSINRENRKGKKLKLPNGNFNYNCVDMYRILFTTHKDRLKLYELLYTDCNIKLERKYVLYSEYYTNTVLTLENKESKAVQRIGDEPLKKEYNSPKSAQHPNVLG